MPCDNEVAQIAPARDGRFDAVLFQRSCGATTGFSTQISVLAHGERPTGAGNAFIADDDHGSARPGAWGGPWADVRWLGRGRLLVPYGSRIFRQVQPEVPRVRITYHAVEASEGR